MQSTARGRLQRLQLPLVAEEMWRGEGLAAAGVTLERGQALRGTWRGGGRSPARSSDSRNDSILQRSTSFALEQREIFREAERKGEEERRRGRRAHEGAASRQERLGGHGQEGR